MYTFDLKWVLLALLLARFALVRVTIGGMRWWQRRHQGLAALNTLQTVLVNAPVAVVAMDQQNLIHYANPTAQSLLALMEGDFAQVMVACADGRLKDVDVKVSDRSAATVVVAAGGYPGSYAKGTVMKLDPTPEGELLVPTCSS